jgi:ABC-type Fe3+/spermidine/putrescine transport system ATPase subunit
VLLLDEPFGALDARIRVEMRAHLLRVQRELGIATIFVTHDQEEAFMLGDRLGIMNAGRLLEVGAPRELYLRPQTEFAATFLGTANILLGHADRTSIHLGSVTFPLQTELAGEADALESRRVQVLFRPEDISLGPVDQTPDGTLLGQAAVDQTAFVGAHERVRLQMPVLRGSAPSLQWRPSARPP